MIRQQRRLLLALPPAASLFAILLVASSALSQTTSPTPTPTPTPTPSQTSTPTPSPPLTPPPSPSPITSVSASELQAQRAKWNAAGIVSYRYTLRVGCFCLLSNPYAVTVRNGVTESFVDGQGRPVTDSSFLLKLATVDGLFEQVAVLTTASNYSEEVVYDTTYGFPAKIAWDFGAWVTDDTMGIEVSDFTVLQPESLPRTGGPR